MGQDYLLAFSPTVTRVACFNGAVVAFSCLKQSKDGVQVARNSDACSIHGRREPQRLQTLKKLTSILKIYMK